MLARPAVSVIPVPVAPAVPTLEIVTCSAFEVLPTQIDSPAVKPVTLATLITGNVAPAPERAGSFVTLSPAACVFVRPGALSVIVVPDADATVTASAVVPAPT